MASFKTLDGVDLNGKRVLMRVDYNVSTDKEGNITDDTRLRNSLPSIRLLQERGAKIILLSHLGRPNGVVVDTLRLDKVAHHLSSLLHHEVRKVDDCVGTAADLVKATLSGGDILLLENVRFHPEEEADNLDFAKQLARNVDIYVNDALAVSHRAHASVRAITTLLPSYAGPLLEQEVQYFERMLQGPERPYVVVIGGAKISDKIGVIRNLLPKVDSLLVGGATANTLLRAEGHAMGSSLVEEDKVELAKELLAQGKGKLFIPIDVLCSRGEDAVAVPVDLSTGHAIGEGMMAKDIGPRTIKLFSEKVRDAETVLWAGPLGLYEDYRFSDGTRKVLEVAAESEAETVAGGGDTLAALATFKLQDKFTFLSTAGGAMLEFLEGRKLPGIAALEKFSQP